MVDLIDALVEILSWRKDFMSSRSLNGWNGRGNVREHELAEKLNGLNCMKNKNSTLAMRRPRLS